MSQRVLAGLGLVALLAQCFVLYTPGSPDATIPIPHLDKVVHFVIFAVPAWFFVRAGARWWLVLSAALIQGLVSEFVQGRWLAHRGADLWDVLFDLLGAAFGVLLAGRWPGTVIGSA